MNSMEQKIFVSITSKNTPSFSCNFLSEGTRHDPAKSTSKLHYAVKTVNKSLDILGKKKKSSRHKNVQNVYNIQHLTLFVDLLMGVMGHKLVFTYALSSDIVKKMPVHEVTLNHM